MRAMLRGILFKAKQEADGCAAHEVAACSGIVGHVGEQTPALGVAVEFATFSSDECRDGHCLVGDAYL
jgi:hypothetical protein